MKKSISAFFFLLFLIASVPVFAQHVDKKKGKFTTYHSNGKKEASGKVKNYKKQGTWKYWNAEGQLEKTAVYKDDVLNGICTEYFKDGSISNQGNYINGKKDGTWNAFYAEGKKASVLNYKNGLKDGEQNRWYENGQLREKTSYTNDVINYRYTWYYNGKNRAVETYENGKPDGTWRQYPDPKESNDTLPSSVDEYKNGLRDGYHRAYHNGKISEEVFYRDGKLNGVLRKWDQTGNLGISENYVNDKRDGLCSYYDKSKLIREATYSNGKINGTEKEYYYGSELTKQSWYKNGIVDSVYTYFADGKTESTRIYKYYPGFVKTEEYSFFTQYDKQGKKLIEGEYHFEIKDRYWVTYYPDGKIKSQTPYSNGKIIGTYKKWYANGKPLIEMQCDGYNVIAQPKVWDEKGKVLKPGTKQYDELVESSKPGEVYNNPAKYKTNRTAIPTDVVRDMPLPMIGDVDQSGDVEAVEISSDVAIEQEDQVFQYVEIMPQFPGGDDSLKAYVRRNIKYPPMAQDNGKQGSVYVRFIVEKDGSVTGVNVVKGVSGAAELDKEAVRVISGMPKWKPGLMNGRPVRTSMILPVKFVLQ